MKPIDIFITAFQRQSLTGETIRYLRTRTNYPYRLTLIDQGGNSMFAQAADLYIKLSENIGIHGAWNMALALAQSEYFITSDNDIYVPDLIGDHLLDTPDKSTARCWLERLVDLMDERPDYGAISLHPHVFIGAENIDPNDPRDVVERNMCGAVMRMMRTDAVYKAGGWERRLEAGRNHEERWICDALKKNGYKVGITSRIRAFHPFPPNWGYPKDFTPEMQKHNPDLEGYVQNFNNMSEYNDKTWFLKL